MAFTLCNKYAKNLCKRILLVQRIIRKCGHMFFGTQYSIMFVKNTWGLGGHVPLSPYGSAPGTMSVRVCIRVTFDLYLFCHYVYPILCVYDN